MKAENQILPELKALRLGDVEIGFPIVQAALSGYSDWPMRVIARRLGAPYTVCEVMLDEFLVNLKVLIMHMRIGFVQLTF